VSKIAEKAVCRSVFLTKFGINKNALLQIAFFGDFAHWLPPIFGVWEFLYNELSLV